MLIIHLNGDFTFMFSIKAFDFRTPKSNRIDFNMKKPKSKLKICYFGEHVLGQ